MLHVVFLLVKSVHHMYKLSHQLWVKMFGLLDSRLEQERNFVLKTDGDIWAQIRDVTMHLAHDTCTRLVSWEQDKKIF